MLMRLRQWICNRLETVENLVWGNKEKVMNYGSFDHSHKMDDILIWDSIFNKISMLIMVLKVQIVSITQI